MITLPEMPGRIASLPRDSRGYPVPWFVAWVDGEPLFHIADAGKARQAVKDRKCWVCGESLGRNYAFVIGPMCSINRVSAEPPQHLECSEFSVRACPFLTKPKMRRLEVPEGLGCHEGAGHMIKRNPGVSCIWSTRRYTIEIYNGGYLFRLGDPSQVSWWAEGRTATREEVDASIESGLPLLQGPAREEGPEAEAALAQMIQAARRYLPAAMAGKAGG